MLVCLNACCATSKSFPLFWYTIFAKVFRGLWVATGPFRPTFLYAALKILCACFLLSRMPYRETNNGARFPKRSFFSCVQTMKRESAFRAPFGSRKATPSCFPFTVSRRRYSTSTTSPFSSTSRTSTLNRSPVWSIHPLQGARSTAAGLRSPPASTMCSRQCWTRTSRPTRVLTARLRWLCGKAACLPPYTPQPCATPTSLRPNASWTCYWVPSPR